MEYTFIGAAFGGVRLQRRLLVLDSTALDFVAYSPSRPSQKMLKKLASPKKRTQHAVPSGATGSTGRYRSVDVDCNLCCCLVERFFLISTCSFDSPDAAGFGDGLESSAKSPESKKKKETKPKPKPKEKERPKPKNPKEKKKDKAKTTDTDLLGFGEATTAGEAPSDEAKEAGNVGAATAEDKDRSPRKSIARAFKRKPLPKQDNAAEEKSPTKKSSKKMYAASLF